MIDTPSELPVSKLYKEFAAKKKKRKKLKKKCCHKYLKKKGKYCGGCPTLYAICQNAGKDF
jgi:coenzyme F420-reducing hydrogenase gamma subunit